MQKSREIVRKIEKSVADTLKGAEAKSLLIAVSGGADSVALLCACARVVPRLGLHIEAVNCNFHLRGNESDRDSAFVTYLCDSIGITLHRLDYDVASYIEHHPGSSTEMACRELRYMDFFRIMEERSLERVAVAHNADDDIETMMLNMLRGSGSRGLRGMDVDNGKVIRPLLSVSRKEIEHYLSELRQDFVTDSSNLTSDYRRNFIRREIIPLIETRWPGARKALSRSVSIMKEESHIIERHYTRQIEELSDNEGALRVYADGVTTGTILRYIEGYGGNTQTAQEISDALAKPFAERIWRLDASHQATLERDRLTIVTDSGEPDDKTDLIWSEMKMSERAMLEVKGCRDHLTAFLPNGKEAYLFRKPTTGDRIAPLGMKGTRLVSDVISDAKLSRDEKEKVKVLTRVSDGEIIWIAGLKRSRHDLIGNETAIIHKVEYRK